MTQKLPLNHINVSTGRIEDFLYYIKKCVEKNMRGYCVPLNLTKYVMSKKDKKLRSVINSANLVISDGISIVWLCRRFGIKNIIRVSGIDLAESVILHSKKNGWKLFFLGASDSNLEQAIENLNQNFNFPKIVGHRHGFYLSNEIGSIIDAINESQADILFLGLGLPQKEYFIYDHLDKIQVKFCLPVGGSFDIWAGEKKRSPKTLQRIGFEWLYRSIFDKSRARYIVKNGFEYFKDILIR